MGLPWLPVLLLLAASPASAEEFQLQRIIIPPPLAQPAVVGIEITSEIPENGYRIVTQTGFAMPFRTDGLARDLLPKASILKSPPPADASYADMIRLPGAFQPVTAPYQTFLFSFAEDVTPVEFTLDLASGAADSIEVRGGRTRDDLKRLYAGPAYGGTHAELPGEAVRFVEVTIGTQGPLKINTMQLLDRPHLLFFRANPGKTYKLLSGGPDEGAVSEFPGYDLLSRGTYDPSLIARLGNATAVTANDDNDGIPASADNCPDVWNLRQEDHDKDGAGDLCDICPTIAGGVDANDNGRCDGLEDPDIDNIPSFRDNCPFVLNRLQEDDDRDGIGNQCDPADGRLSLDKPWVIGSGIVVMVVVLLCVAAIALRRG